MTELGIGFRMRKQPIQKNTACGETAEPSAIAASDDEEVIAELAHQLWIDRGQPEGSPEEDWFRAQEMVRCGQSLTASSTMP